jgi:O-methyltransferase involved in polyketide biosynthesis
MSEIKSQTLDGVSETLLVTLYLRVMESQRPDALIKDEKAVALVTRMSYDFDRVRQIPLSEANRLVIILRNRELDRYAWDFLVRHPEAVVVHIGCGLDSRFDRVDNGRLEWYDLDLPEVIELRRKLIGGEGERYHLLGCSVLDNAWLEKVSPYRQRPFLFLAEGVFMYLEEAQIKSLVLTLRDHFPGSELVFDAYSPLHVWVHNLQTSISKIQLSVNWGIWHGQEIEGWGDGIRLLDEWGFFDPPEPRLDHIRWMRRIESLARTLRIYHFQLGKVEECTQAN